MERVGSGVVVVVDRTGQKDRDSESERKHRPDRKTEGQTDRQAGSQSGRQAGRQTETERDRE